MSFYLLDTDTLSLLQDGHAAVRAAVAACAPANIAITVISVEEQLSGWYTLIRNARKPEQLARAYDRLTATTRFFSSMAILSFSEAAIRRSMTLKASKLNVGKMDLCIAAIALEHRAIVVTRNLRDFQRVPNLVVEDWSK
jgi:tRNA(fMet)-specific endonuclease VapC